MSDFIAPLGSLPSGGKRKVFNPSKLNRSGEEPSLLSQYHSKDATKEEKSAIFKKLQDEYARERANDRMIIC